MMEQPICEYYDYGNESNSDNLNANNNTPFVNILSVSPPSRTLLRSRRSPIPLSSSPTTSSITPTNNSINNNVINNNNNNSMDHSHPIIASTSTQPIHVQQHQYVAQDISLSPLSLSPASPLHPSIPLSSSPSSSQPSLCAKNSISININININNNKSPIKEIETTCGNAITNGSSPTNNINNNGNNDHNNASSSKIDISDFECSLCFRVFLQPVTTICGHVFCKQCIFSSLKYSSQCPLCRHKLETHSSSSPPVQH